MKWWAEILKQVIGSRIGASISLVKIQAAIAYMNLIKGTRRVAILLCVLVVGMVVLACGFLLVPIALCLFMPWTPETRAIVAISVGAAYVVIPLIVMMVLFSEKRWMRAARMDKVLKEALKR
jgi:hypothetical protein